jgi:membrane fusion protein (multidrug efflux system)
MSTTRRFIIVTLGLLLVFGAIAGYKVFEYRMMQQYLNKEEPPALVDATRAESREWVPSLHSVGSVRAVNGIRVANEVPGVVEEIQFESGDMVEAGDVLVRLDAETDKAALETRKAEAERARQEFERLSNLVSRDAVSQSQYDEAKANFDASRARVNAQQAQLRKKIIRAPFPGKTGLRQVDQGEYMATGTPIVEINMVDPIYVEYTVPEKHLGTISAGDRVTTTVAAFPDRIFEGEISAINSSVSAESRTVRVRATLDNKDGALRPGMFANVRTLRSEPRKAVVVPRTAISFNTYGDFVYVIAENDKGELVTERRSVETGVERDRVIEVTSGLEAGEQVVETGLLRLRAEQRVEIAEDDDEPKDDVSREKGENAAEQGAAD